MAIPLKAVIAVLAGIVLSSPIQALSGFAYTRDLAVPVAGWVRVPLDPAALRHMAPGGADLHVFAPDGSGVPFRLVALLTTPGPILTLTARGVKCEHHSARAVCTLELPAGQILRQVTVEIEGEGPVGYRLDEPREARWEPVAEGVWQPGPEGEARRYVLSGGPKAVAGALRLELYGQDEAPRLTGYALDFAIPNVLFRAAAPGRYVLAYGGSGGGSAPKAGRPGSAPVLWVQPGPERESPPPPLPAELGPQLDGIRFSGVWIVSATAAEPGQLVRLELPAAVYAAAREDLADLRLTSGGRQIPFFRWSPPAPLLTAGQAELHPAESDRPGESRVVVSLPAENLPLTQLHLTTASGEPLRRPVTVIYVDPDRRSPRSGRAAREPAARGTWTCVPQAPLPCRERLALRGPAPRILTVRLRDGDNPRLRAVDVAVWRRRDVLLFVWPNVEDVEDDEVRLLAGAKALEAPRYDFAALGPALLGHPWEAAEIRSLGEAPKPPWWNRWVMPAALVVVALWLLVLLRRILSEA